MIIVGNAHVALVRVRQQARDAAFEGKTHYVPRPLTAVSARIRRAPRVWAAAGALLAVVVAVLLWITFRG